MWEGRTPGHKLICLEQAACLSGPPPLLTAWLENGWVPSHSVSYLKRRPVRKVLWKGGKCKEFYESRRIPGPAGDEHGDTEKSSCGVSEPASQYHTARPRLIFLVLRCSTHCKGNFIGVEPSLSPHPLVEVPSIRGYWTAEDGSNSVPITTSIFSVFLLVAHFLWSLPALSNRALPHPLPG